MRVFELPEGELGLGLGPVPGHHFSNRPVVVIGDQHVLAEDLILQRGAGIGVDVPGQAQVLGLGPGQVPEDDAPHPRLGRDRGDLGFDLVPGAAGLAAGQGRGQLIQFLAGLGQRGAVEPAGLAVAQLRGVGQDGAPLGAVDHPAGVAGGQPAEPVLIHDRAFGGGQPGQVRAVAGGHRPDVVQARGGEVREVRLGVLPETLLDVFVPPEGMVGHSAALVAMTGADDFLEAAVQRFSGLRPRQRAELGNVLVYLMLDGHASAARPSVLRPGQVPSLHELCRMPTIRY